MSQRSPIRVKCKKVAGLVTGNVVLILVSLVLAMDSTAFAQSTRLGWGSTPYHDVSGTGVTFRVWAPNATNVTTPGSFNGWSTSATPLTQELSNGVPTGVWSADVATATNLSQYKYYIYTNSNNGMYKHD